MCPSGGPGALAAGTVSRYKTGPWLAIHRIPYIWSKADLPGADSGYGCR